MHKVAENSQGQNSGTADEQTTPELESLPIRKVQDNYLIQRKIHSRIVLMLSRSSHVGAALRSTRLHRLPLPCRRLQQPACHTSDFQASAQNSNYSVKTRT